MSQTHESLRACSTAWSIWASVSVRPLLATCSVTVARQSVLERMSSESGRDSPAPIATGRIHVGRAAIEANVLRRRHEHADEPPEGGLAGVVFHGGRDGRLGHARLRAAAKALPPARCGAELLGERGARIDRRRRLAVGGYPVDADVLPLEDVGDRAVVRRHGLSVDRERLQVAATGRPRARTWICETSKEVVMPLSYFLRAASRLRSASSWALAPASIWRAAVSMTRCASRTPTTMSCSSTVRLAFDVSRLNWATPRAPRAVAIQDRVGEHEPDSPVLEVLGEELVSGVPNQLSGDDVCPVWSKTSRRGRSCRSPPRGRAAAASGSASTRSAAYSRPPCSSGR